ncbi:hypothetical protein NDS46_31385 (plasmid) [Paenibacillus thiaminolyticus]|uniref:hypothetical protein n=1 Tax=Paenibacillus thiaminolyticus TaxID=49283 RepID=UPI00232DDC3C|nr:hypothetical protein [Paenibacillus thiaminolyticus]WCF11462.1 hypothetical protein NDS46_31385 [Paenibacillus thiaminolyticus]
MGKQNDPSIGQDKPQPNRRTFSVSKGFSDVHTILNALPENEASRFICEAIRFYNQYKTNPNWMGEQLQSLVAITTQLQQAMVGLGGIPSPPPSGFNQTNPQMTNISQAHDYENTNESSQTTIFPEKVATNDQPYSEPTTVHGIKEAHNEVAPTTQEDTMAVEREDRYKTEAIEMNLESGQPRKRRRSGIASSLASKSMGKKQQ